MVFRADDIKVIVVGNGLGVILPAKLLNSYNIEPGDQVRIDIPDIYRGNRKRYQSDKGYIKVGNRWVKRNPTRRRR